MNRFGNDCDCGFEKKILYSGNYSDSMKLTSSFE